MSRLKVAPEHWMFLHVLTAVASAEPPALYAAMSNPARSQGLLLALLEVLRRTAVQQPLLICLEDLHWGDAALFALLGKLLDATDEAPIVWLLTSVPKATRWKAPSASTRTSP